MALGRKTGGRQKGTPNVVTREVREVFKLMFEGLAPDVEKWIRTTAETDPSRAASLTLDLAEYHLPKLQRIEKTITDASDEELLEEVRRRATAKAVAE